jgi:Mismatch repair ATPase (MutS family)
VLAEEVVKALKFIGARCVFATHLHELAERIDTINASVDGDAMLYSVVAGIAAGDESHRRTYRIEPGPPSGSSYAADIAKQAGISFDALISEHKSGDGQTPHDGT